MRSFRSIRRAAVAVLATVMVMAMALPGSARTLDLDDGFTLVGPGPTYWDFEDDDSGCETSGGFTPVDDGEFGDQSDAFDGGLVVAVDGTDFFDGDGIAQLSDDGMTVRVRGTRVDGIQVSRIETVLSSSPTLRSVIRLRNTTDEAKRVTVMWDSNLGSDSSEEVRASSSGNTSYNLNDRWVVSSDSSSGPSDPVLTFALFGKGALVQTDDIVNNFGGGCFTVEYRVKVPSHSKRFLLMFTRMNGANSRAIKTATDFDNVSAGDALLAGLPERVTSRTVNWNL